MPSPAERSRIGGSAREKELGQQISAPGEAHLALWVMNDDGCSLIHRVLEALELAACRQDASWRPEP